ncbi:hypothetical protein ACFYPK_22380 [Streptomyces halstedii]|nr:hypothetical protein [Streptomyces sp. NTK 937]WSX34658.1 hypothetical protein OG291_02790 [Streptomyces halstedii]
MIRALVIALAGYALDLGIDERTAIRSVHSARQLLQADLKPIP